MDADRPPRTRMAWLRPFTTRFVNPLSRLVAGRLPWFAIVHQVGRRSGRRHDTPMNPELVVEPQRRLVRQPVRAFLGLLRVTEFLRMRERDTNRS